MGQIIKGKKGAEDGRGRLCKGGQDNLKAGSLFFISNRMFRLFLGHILVVLYENVFLPLFVRNHCYTYHELYFCDDVFYFKCLNI